MEFTMVEDTIMILLQIDYISSDSGRNILFTQEYFVYPGLHRNVILNFEKLFDIVLWNDEFSAKTFRL